MKFQNNKWAILLPVLVIAVLAAAFCFGGNVPSPQSPHTAGDTHTTDALPKEAPVPVPEQLPPHTESDAAAEQDPYFTDSVPEGKPLPAEPQDAVISSTAYTCTLSISCATLLENTDALDSTKADLIPDDGWILPPTNVTFYEGESVFNILQRTCKQQKIHMEFEDTPIYNSAYIEGIHNLYEFDAGELSGWMYSVNDWFPNYGCSRYRLEDGDVICWVYTCDLGADVGGAYSAGNGRG